MKTWKDGAALLSTLYRTKDWSHALPIAASVGKGPRKTTAKQFAEAAGVSESTITRYLSAWAKAAEAGVVPAADTMTPDALDTFVAPDRPLSEFYNTAAEGLYPKRVARSIEMHGAEKIVEVLSEQQRTDVAAALIKTATPTELNTVRRTADDKFDADHAQVRQMNVEARARERAEKDSSDELVTSVELLFAQVDRRLNEILDGVKDAPNNEALAALLAERVPKTKALLDLIGSGKHVDWDAALASIEVES